MLYCENCGQPIETTGGICGCVEGEIYVSPSTTICSYQDILDRLDRIERWMSERLKPCPFCGGEIIVKKYEDTGGDYCEHYLSHESNGCVLEGIDIMEFKTKQESIDAWNTRTEDING